MRGNSNTLLADEGSSRRALMITAVEDLESAAAQLASHLNLAVEIVSSRAHALRLLERRIYSIVVLDQTLADSDPDGADLIWKISGEAIPVQFSFALSGSMRLEREIRAALARRQREEVRARAAACASVNAEIRNAVTGFLLESRLALSEPGLTPGVRPHLESLAQIAAKLQELLSRPGVLDATPGGLHPPAN